MVICYDRGLLIKGSSLDFRPIEKVGIFVKALDAGSPPRLVTFVISPRRCDWIPGGIGYVKTKKRISEGLVG